MSVRDRLNSMHANECLLSGRLTEAEGARFGRVHDIETIIQVFNHLESLCANQQAQKSLDSFRKRYAVIAQIPELLEVTQKPMMSNRQARRSTMWSSGRGNTQSGHDETPPPPALSIPRKPVPGENFVLGSPSRVSRRAPTHFVLFLYHYRLGRFARFRYS